jgi:hypothetical protein
MFNPSLLALVAREKMQTLYQEARVQRLRRENSLSMTRKQGDNQPRIVWVGQHATHPIFLSE